MLGIKSMLNPNVFAMPKPNQHKTSNRLPMLWSFLFILFITLWQGQLIQETYKGKFLVIGIVFIKPGVSLTNLGL